MFDEIWMIHLYYVYKYVYTIHYVIECFDAKYLISENGSIFILLPEIHLDATPKIQDS